MKNLKVISIALLAGIAIFSIYKYVVTLKEKEDLLNTVSQMKEQVAALEIAKQNLSQELEKEKQLSQELTQGLKVSEERLAKVNASLVTTVKALEDLNSQHSILKTENTALKEQNDNLKLQVTQVTQEKDELKARMSSVKELKKAIRELKRQMRKVKTQIIAKEKTTTTATETAVEGNRGFLIKDGKPTSSPKVIIEVKPLPTSE